MARNLVVFDDSTGRYVRSSLLEGDVGGFIEAVYAVASPTTDFPAPSGSTITADNMVEFDRNGQGLFEGASDDFTRDVGNNKVVSNYSIPAGAKVRVRVYAG